MKKGLLFVAAFVMCIFVSGCKGGEDDVRHTDTAENIPAAVIESAPGEDIQQTIVNEEADRDGKIFIDADFFVEALEESMELDSKDYEFYNISSFSNLNSKTHKFFMVSDVQIYKDISSLLILALSDKESACWLVNYGKNNKYISALTVGHTGPDKKSIKTESVINTKRAPYYIDITNSSPESKESIKVEILPTGQFNEISRINAGDAGGV